MLRNSNGFVASVMQYAAYPRPYPRLLSTTCARYTVIPPSSESKGEPSTIFDAFNDPNIIKDAQARWGLGATSASYAPIVFPNGRPEISESTKKMTQARIADGYVGQRINKKDQNCARDIQAQTLMGSLGRGKASAAVSPNPHLHKLSNEVRNNEPTPLWQKHKIAIKEKMLGKTWNPQRKLSRQAMDEVRYLRKQFPEEWTAQKLADHFNVASESIVRILKTNFQPSPERAEEQDLARHRARKANVSADLERRKAERHAIWLEKKAEREKKAKQIPSRIKLGAPKRST
ncbi:hypothetical protein MVEG_03053 [Podila verticillata NRRL 6337]|nr:hypothetical protein MVEG_03053 [Podila verticillata NRRL 6337]